MSFFKNLFGGGGPKYVPTPQIAAANPTVIAPPTPVDASMTAGGVNQRRQAAAAAEQTLKTGPRGLAEPYAGTAKRKTLLGE